MVFEAPAPPQDPPIRGPRWARGQLRHMQLSAYRTSSIHKDPEMVAMLVSRLGLTSMRASVPIATIVFHVGNLFITSEIKANARTRPTVSLRSTPGERSDRR